MLLNFPERLPKFHFPKITIKKEPIDLTSIDVVPRKYSEYLTDLNYLMSVGANIYNGRDKEINQLFNVLLKTITPNAILLGESGVGKSAIVKAAVLRVLSGNCPEALKGNHFIYLDLDQIASVLSSTIGTKVPKAISESFTFLTSFSNIIVVIDKIYLMETVPMLQYYLSKLITLPNVKLIGMSSEKLFNEFFEYDRKVLSSVDIIRIDEPKPQKIYPMIKDYIQILGSRHSVSISEDLVNYIVSLSAAFPAEIVNPGLTLNIVEKSMIAASRNNRDCVEKENINCIFDFNFELYKNMSIEDKTITAYHEAGHFIVARKSENIKNFRPTAITIIPADYFLGVTLFEMELEKQVSCDYDYYVDAIAIDLAGREAELLRNKEKMTSGASSDLIHATQTARDVITRFGMVENCGKNMTFFCDDTLVDFLLLSEERKKFIDAETSTLIEKASKRAQHILEENSELLTKIAQALLEKEVLDSKDLDTLCNPK